MSTIKYKDTTIRVEAGQTVTLSTADKKLTGDIEVIAKKLIPINIYKYDESVVLVTTLFENGMSWRDWTESEYNTYSAYIENNGVMFPVGSTSYEYLAGICADAGSINIDNPIDPAITYILD